jgi:uncharacterized membrane protein YfcA
MHEQAFVYIVMGLSAFLIGFSKGGLGGMMGALVTALMALVLPVDVAIGSLLPLLIFGDIIAVALHWRKWDSRVVRLLIPGAIMGSILAMIFITNVSVETLQASMGVVILLFTAFRFVEQRVISTASYQPRRWHGWLVGGTAGAASTLAHVGGPLVTIYLLLQELPPRIFVATSALFFMILNWIKVPGYLVAGLLDGSMFAQWLWTVPLVPLGAWVGRWMVERVEQRIFERVMLVLLVISALTLLVR